MSDPLFDQVDAALDILKVRLHTLRFSILAPEWPISTPLLESGSPKLSISTPSLNGEPGSTLSIRSTSNLWRVARQIFQEADAALQRGIDLILHQDLLACQRSDFTISPSSSDTKHIKINEEHCDDANYSSPSPSTTPTLPPRHPEHNMLLMSFNPQFPPTTTPISTILEASPPSASGNRHTFPPRTSSLHPPTVPSHPPEPINSTPSLRHNRPRSAEEVYQAIRARAIAEMRERSVRQPSSDSSPTEDSESPHRRVSAERVMGKVRRFVTLGRSGSGSGDGHEAGLVVPR